MLQVMDEAWHRVIGYGRDLAPRHALCTDSPLEQTLDVSPGSPLSVPLSWPSLSSPRQCRDRSRGPSLLEAGELQGERGPLDRMSVIMKRDREVWW